MNFNEYQKKSASTDRYLKNEVRLFGNKLIYPALGIAGESGEYVDKIKKLFRDKNGKLDAKTKEELALELGDILWYIAKAARALSITLDDVAKKNLVKLASRHARNMIHGQGDNR